MENSIGVGFMAVFAVTGSVVILAHQIHKRLLSDFMKDIEFELSGDNINTKNGGFGIYNGTTTTTSRFGIGCEKRTTKKTVRFADDVVEPSSNNKEYRKKRNHNNLENHAISSI